MEYIRAFDDFQQSYKGEFFLNYQKNTLYIPIACTVAYLIMVFAGPKLMANREAFTARWSFTAWNLMLCVFSIFGTYYTVPVTWRMLMDNGAHRLVCQDVSSWCTDGPSGVWTAAFCLSKIPELFDTFFLIIRKKPVVFLQYWHHTTVMLFTWHAMGNAAAPGMLFATMNFVVHAVMYGYFAMTSAFGFTRKMVKPFAPLITMLQILQMVIGTVVAFYTAYHFETSGRLAEGGCDINVITGRSGIIMYSSYLVLFAILFRDNYLKPKKKSGSKGKKSQ